MLCPICRNPNTKIYRKNVTSVYSEKAFDINTCPQCGHFFTAPAPTAAELDDIYTHRYSYDAHFLIRKEKQQRAEAYAKLIAKLQTGKRVLEVGCMHGFLLNALKNRSFIVEGVELDPEAVEHCQKQGLPVVQSSVENYLSTSPNQQDVIVMSHVLEHLADPEKQLQALATSLSASGRLVMIVPNSWAITRRVFGKNWGYWQVPVHINHFNPKSMRTLLKQSGYEVERIGFFGGDSLFFLSSLANLLHSRNEAKHLSSAKKAFVKVASFILRPWTYVGREDMLVVARKITTAS